MFSDLPPIAIPPVKSELYSLSSLEQEVHIQLSYAGGFDCNPASITKDYELVAL
jgi:hypothetical protein